MEVPQQDIGVCLEALTVRDLPQDFSLMIQLLKIKVLPSDLVKYFTFMSVLGNFDDLNLLAIQLVT
jgi:hypothetical protein